jgi:exosome complex component CSL4
MADKFVLPGELIKTDKKIGSGAYNEDGKVYASVAGVVKEDEIIVTVEAKNQLVSLHRGDLVIASVEGVKEKVVLVKIKKVVGKNRTLPTEDFGVIRVMDIAPRYTERASDEFKVGDIIKAEVVQVLPNDVIMTTKGPNLGVIEGYCGRCRGILELDGEKLTCSICGKDEKRKISRDYLLKKET